MNTATEWVNQLLGSSALSSPVRQSSSFASSQLVDSTLRLLAVAKDLPQSINRQNQQLHLLVSMTRATVPLANLDPVCSLLAGFEWQSFSASSAQTQDLSILSNKVHGLWPACEWSLEEEISANPHWQISRKVLHSYYCQSNCTSERQQLGFLMLLGSDKLTQISEGEGHWQQVWSYLYLWFHSKLLGEQAGGSWSMRQDQFYANQISYLKDDLRSNQQLFAHHLLQHMIGEYLMGDSECFSLQKAAETFQSFQVPTAQDEMWEFMLQAEVLRQILLRSNMKLAAQACGRKLAGVKDLVKGQRVQGELSYLLPHLMQREELVQYVRSNRLDFWEYGLDEETTQTLAKQALEHHFDSLNEEKQFLIVSKVQSKTLVEGVMNASNLKQNPRLCKCLSRMALRRPDQLSKVISHGLKLEENENNVMIFGQQWAYYNEFVIAGITHETLSSIRQLLTLCPSETNQISPHTLPQDDSQIYCQIATKYAYFLAAEWSNLTVESQELCKKVFLQRSFVSNMEKLNEDQTCQLWQGIAQLLLRDASFMESLMNLKPIDNE